MLAKRDEKLRAKGAVAIKAAGKQNVRCAFVLRLWRKAGKVDSVGDHKDLLAYYAKGACGVRGKILSPLTEEEVAKLQASARKLKDVINQIEY